MTDKDNIDTTQLENEVKIDENSDIENKSNLLEESLKQAQEDILRVKAESENLRKRYEKQISDMKDFAISSFAKDLLGVMDNMNRALHHVPEILDENIKNIIIGVEMTKKELDNVVSRHGISVINPQIGEVFDHNSHQVISQIDSKDYPSGSIIDVPQLGYSLKGRLLRPASVIVVK